MKLDEKGFSLVEVIASIVIITIVLLSVTQLIIRSNVTATYNNEKLVVTDLAQTVLKRLEVESHAIGQVIQPSLTNIEIPLDEINLTGLKAIETSDHKKIYVLESDKQTYQVEAYVKPPNKTEQKNLGMNLVLVKVNRIEIKTDGIGIAVKKLTGKSEIEGFVNL